MDTPKDLMREEKSRTVVSENPDWSKLCPDLLRKIIQRLSFFSFHRAKTVCSDWYSVWKTCVMPIYPCQMIYQDGSLKLFDPKDDKLYATEVIGLSDDNYCMASSGNCLLMVNSRIDFYIFNLVTRKRINLPSLKSLLEEIEWEHLKWGDLEFKDDVVWKDIIRCRRLAVLWLNEKTGDYMVAWIFKHRYVLTLKNGIVNWRSHEGIDFRGYLHLAYKNSNLYLYTNNGHIEIIDFSNDYPKEEINKNPYRCHPFQYYPKILEDPLEKRIAIQKSGEVLIILMSLSEVEGVAKYLFYVFKLNFESGQWERVYSIGDGEMLIFGHGVTIRAPVQDVGDGIKSDSICFAEDDLWSSDYDSYCGVFDLATTCIKWTKRLGGNITRIQWFVPGFV